MGTNLNCIDKSMQFKWVPTTYALIKKVDKTYTVRNLKTTKFLDCALIGVCVVIKSNTYFKMLPSDLYVKPAVLTLVCSLNLQQTVWNQLLYFSHEIGLDISYKLSPAISDCFLMKIRKKKKKKNLIVFINATYWRLLVCVYNISSMIDSIASN